MYLYLRHLYLIRVKRARKKIAKTRAEEKRLREQSASPSRSCPAYLSYQSDLHLFPPIRKPPQCCRFRKCSVAIAKSVSARLRARAAGIGPSIRFPRYKRDATTPPLPPPSHRHIRRLIALIYPQRLFIIYSSFTRTLSAGCLSRFPILCLASLLAKFFSHPFSAPFPVKFFGFLYAKSLSFIRSYINAEFLFNICFD